MRLTTKLLGVSSGFLLAAAAMGCGGTTTGSMCSADQITGTDYKYATNSLKLPDASNSYAIDIDGDGKKDNQLKAIVSAIGSQFDLDTPVAMAVASGEAVILADVTTADLTGGCAKATLNLAQMPANPPKYDGTDTFMVKSGAVTAALVGQITGGKLSTTLPKDQRGDQVQKVSLSLPLAEKESLPLTIYGAHISGDISATGVMNGELHGVILNTDIQGQIIPAVAQVLTDQIHKDPMGSTAQTIIHLFEDPSNPASVKKCMVMADCCMSNPATCKITADEVSSNALIGNVLAPDVQVQQNGTWDPLPGGKMKDGMSVGIGFTMVKASF